MLSFSSRCGSFFCMNIVLIGVLLVVASVNYCWTTNNAYEYYHLQQLRSKAIPANFRDDELKAQQQLFGEEEESLAENLRRQASEDDKSKNDQNNVSSVYTKQMKQGNLNLSLKQQQKFHLQKGLITEHFPLEKRYRAFTYEWAATQLNDDFAYIHIYKNGGTTVAVQTGNAQTKIEDPTIQGLKWMTFVRDPIDHFLSGWAECGSRSEETPGDESYDRRIQRWLDEAKTLVGKERPGCIVHSFPQGNFLLNDEGTVNPQMVMIGDLREMEQVLGLAGFEYDASRGQGRISSNNEFKLKHYPSRKDLISDKTMRRICSFVALDYFLFDFELPDACQENSS